MDKEVVGDAAAYLEEGMSVILSVHEGRALALELPRHATLEVVETERSSRANGLVVLQAGNSCRTASARSFPAHHPAPASSSSRKTAPTSSAPKD